MNEKQGQPYVDCRLVGHVLRTNSVFQYIPHTYTYSTNFDKWVHRTYDAYIHIVVPSGAYIQYSMWSATSIPYSTNNIHVHKHSVHDNST